MHLDDRISVEPGSPRRGQSSQINYCGLLVHCGADAVWMHYGFDGWENVQDQQMDRLSHGGFTCTAPVTGSREMNFCFKDSANHWDNNGGSNWTLRIG